MAIPVVGSLVANGEWGDTIKARKQLQTRYNKGLHTEHSFGRV